MQRFGMINVQQKFLERVMADGLEERVYDKYVDGLDIEFKSDNFSKGPRSKSL